MVGLGASGELPDGSEDEPAVPGAAAARAFTVNGWKGEVNARLPALEVANEVERLTDPSAAVQTVHWGRNYLYAAQLDAAAERLPVVVKQFRPRGWRDRVRGSRGRRSWRAAWELVAAGVPTPEPLLLIERADGEGPSFYVSRRLLEASEVRHFFRRLNHEPEPGPFPEVDPSRFLSQLGRFARRIHDAGIWYRDLSIGNVLARPGDGGELDLFLVDCNRARGGRRLGVIRRCRDLCRLPVLERSHRDAFLTGYWGKAPPAWAFRRWFWVLAMRAYLLKHAVKGRLRRLKPARRHARGAGHHPHIPPAEPDTSLRDRAVWDHLSDQPHQHAGRWEKLFIRVLDSPEHLRDASIVAASAPAVWRRFVHLRDRLYREPVTFGRIGLALRPWSGHLEAQLEAVQELGVTSLLLRLHPWESDHGDEERLAAELARRGLDVAFAVPQTRDLVRDRERWRSAIEEIAERFTPFGSSFQIGQAPNRSKWGIWTRREYLNLFVDAARILRRRPGVQLLGPAVIDFELHHTLAVVNRRVPGLDFDVLSALLYVDRRGAPESRQLGFDTVDKVVLLRAIADVGRATSSRCWITEVNWPLLEGPHAPAGKAAAVDEERQADYLARYYLLTLGTGLVERVYWWRLVARGYGLAVPEGDGLRLRPAFRALTTLQQLLGGSTFLGPEPVREDGYLYRFRRDGDELVVGWSPTGGVAAHLPRPAVAAVGRDGLELEPPPATEVVLGPSPTYYLLSG